MLKTKSVRIPESYLREEYTISWETTVLRFMKEDWNALMSGQTTPFFEWEWFYCLENSNAIGGNSGWFPLYLTITDKNKTLCAIVPLFLKVHSAGEFVFDHILADTAIKLGFNYYPKLIGMSPFTPGSHFRLCGENLNSVSNLYPILFQAIDDFVQMNSIFGSHFLHVNGDETAEYHSRGYIRWNHESYVWNNEQYRNFDDFLSALNAKRRKNIRSQRRQLAKENLRYSVKTGDELTENDFINMYGFYENTCDKFGTWGSKYLSEKFFRLLATNYKHRCVIFQADYEGRNYPTGMSIFIRKNGYLFGRYWGATEDIEFLHFELCYYRAIEWCIENEIQFFDAGAGNGPHKIQRGFKVSENISWHKFVHRQYHGMVEDYFGEMNKFTANTYR